MATHLEAPGHATVRALTRARLDLRGWHVWHRPEEFRSG